MQVVYCQGLSVINFAFTILEEGNLVLSVKGNHSFAILRVSEDYDDLLQSLQDVISEVKDLETVTINDVSYQIQLFFGAWQLEISSNYMWFGICNITACVRLA